MNLNNLVRTHTVPCKNRVFGQLCTLITCGHSTLLIGSTSMVGVDAESTTGADIFMTITK
jgi:hypothetical protein